MDQLTVLGERFAEAVRYAAELHREQPRKDTNIPYVSHLLGVASLVLDQEGDEDEAIAGLLHDALEDQGDKTSEGEIRRRFGDKVARIVVALSDFIGEGEKPDWQLRKQQYLAHLDQQPADVLRVSLADKLHNARAIAADLRVSGDTVWKRFRAGPTQQAWYYSSLLEVFRRHHDSPLVEEFAAVVAELVERADQAPVRASG